MLEDLISKAGKHAIRIVCVLAIAISYVENTLFIESIDTNSQDCLEQEVQAVVNLIVSHIKENYSDIDLELAEQFIKSAIVVTDITDHTLLDGIHRVRNSMLRDFYKSQEQTKH